MENESAQDRDERESSWTRRLPPGGSDPDPRLSLANERTFLAWIRTALGLIALGVGVAAASWIRWIWVERALRARRGIPSPRMGPALAFGVSVMAVVAIIAVVLAP